MTTLKSLWDQHPNLVSWFILSVGMIGILMWSGKHVGFSAGQWAALVAATVILAGLSVWIISWEDDETADNGNET